MTPLSLCVTCRQISDVVYNLQRERNMASFYLSSHKRNTKADLVEMYRATDQSIANIAEWPDVDKGKGQFLSRAAYMRSLNEHRYTLETEGRSQRRELTDYSAFITVMMGWLVTSISVPEASRIYMKLVAMHEAIEANNAFGLVRMQARAHQRCNCILFLIYTHILCKYVHLETRHTN